MPILQVKNVCKTFGTVHALQGIDLEVEEGETIAVIGPSGCGKTTLLRCLGLFDKIDQGEIRFEGKVVITSERGCEPALQVDANLYHSRVGMVFQHLNIWPHLTVQANLVLAPTTVLGMNKRETLDKAIGLLEKMGVREKLHDYPQTLSGGQLQRVALARALMMDPALLLLDEITSALDPELVGDILDIIAVLVRNGTTMIIVTHEMQFAEEVAARVVFLDSGSLVESGNPRVIFRDPKTPRLSDFLGRMSRHRSRVKEAE